MSRSLQLFLWNVIELLPDYAALTFLKIVLLSKNFVIKFFYVVIQMNLYPEIILWLLSCQNYI